MPQPYIELRERRELGTIISDSFTFIRINRRLLWNVLIKTSGVFFLLSVALAGLYQYMNASSWMVSDPLTLLLVVFLLMFSSILFYSSIAAAIYSFMQYYIDTKGDVQEEVVIQEARSKIGHVIVLSIISAFIMFFALILFIIPGIYVAIPLALVLPVFCFRKIGIMESIQAAFKLVSGYWWITFGTLLVVYIVFMVISFVFQLPSTIYLGVKTFFSATGGNGELSGDFIYLILATVSSASSNLLSVIVVICIGLIYLDLDEEKNRTGIKAKLEELG